MAAETPYQVKYISDEDGIYTLEKLSDKTQFQTGSVDYGAATWKETVITEKKTGKKDPKGIEIVETITTQVIHPILELPPVPPFPDSPAIVDPKSVDSNQTSIYGIKEQQSRKYKIGNSTTDSSKGETIHAGLALRSQFNDWALFKYFNLPGVEPGNLNSFHKEYGQAMIPDYVLDPSAQKIIEYANKTNSKSFAYKLNDFAQCEHYGQISNDYMITLRRFAFPIPDDIVNTTEFKSGNPKPIDTTQPDLARAITWLSPALGNDLKEVIKFSVKYNWKETESEMQTLQAASATGENNRRGIVGGLFDGNNLLSGIEAGINGYSADAAMRKNMYQGGGDPFKDTYPNHIFGPLNVIKKVLARDQGLEFEQEFSLKFHYNIKAYPNTSPRIAFMDTIANLLALTYSTAPFWGGATRYVGGGSGKRTGKPFGDYEKLRNGDYAGFGKSLMDDMSNMITKGGKDLMAGLGAAADAIMSGDAAGALNGLGNSKILDQFIGGGLMKMFGGPMGAQGGQVAAAFLSGDPTGQWHLTIGNPLSPICVIGNLAMTDANFEFEGPMSLEGFPSKVTCTVKLKSGRPRDKADIESMFNAGRGRLYLQPDVENAPDLNTIMDVDSYGKKTNAGLVHRISNYAAG